ncbi:MAG: sulfotransferase [Rubrobacter sp.]|nr:sulfotransferase [Rubrobacter sp.]
MRERVTELKNVRKQASQQRKTLHLKSQEIEQLRMELSVSGAAAADRDERPQTEERSNPGSLPDFLIIGAQKAGTTFLYYLLCQHPYVAPTSEKELHFFDSQKFNKGEGWYRSNFPPPTSENGHKVITGEASPYYIYHPLAARRAAQVVPHARLIVLLRNPVDRAYSDYQNRLREGNEFLGFEEAIEAEEERIKGEKEKMLADEGYSSASHRRHSYLARGVCTTTPGR